MLRASKAPPLEVVAGGRGSEAEDAARHEALDNAARAALGGDPSALREFLRAVAPIVRRVCRGVMGRDNPELEDAIQDCLIDVARSLPQFRFEGAVAHYVTKIAMRRAIATRDRARALAKQHATLDASNLPVASIDRTPAAHAELVSSLLDDLNEAQAKALLMHIMLGHSIDEIASMTGVSANTVKTRLRLAKEQLRRWLRRSGEGRRAGG
jgi:RNA polymerase sigma-70 factor (ECF subfamily)